MTRVSTRCMKLRANAHEPHRDAVDGGGQMEVRVVLEPHRPEPRARGLREELAVGAARRPAEQRREL